MFNWVRNIILLTYKCIEYRIMNRIGQIHRPTDNARPRVGFDVLHLLSDVLRQGCEPSTSDYIHI